MRLFRFGGKLQKWDIIHDNDNDKDNDNDNASPSTRAVSEVTPRLR